MNDNDLFGLEFDKLRNKNEDTYNNTTIYTQQQQHQVNYNLPQKQQQQHQQQMQQYQINQLNYNQQFPIQGNCLIM